jgi:ring-1,2-phenylacetyl-CoA epoxidase subunit PaaC
VEQLNEDFAFTIVRQFLFDQFNWLQMGHLTYSEDKKIAAIATKSLKEVRYHRKFSSEWMIRLGDGTELSNEKMQEALNALWMYTGEMFLPVSYEMETARKGIGVKTTILKTEWLQYVETILSRAKLQIPKNDYMLNGGKKGIHSEYLGHMLSEMQFLQRAYPGLNW